MKLLRLVASCLVLLAFVRVIPAANTSDVFNVETTLRGIIQRGATGVSITDKVVISADDFINLAQSRVLGTPVPKSEILALVNDCTTSNPAPTRLIVFDTTGASNIITIGSLSNLAVAADSRKHFAETITQVTINDISTADTNGILSGITGGSFYFHAKISVPTNGCPSSFAGQLTGFLGTAFPSTCSSNFCTNVVVAVLTNCMTNVTVNCETNFVDKPDCSMVVTFPCTDAIKVVIPRSPIVTGKSIGTLIEP